MLEIGDLVEMPYGKKTITAKVLAVIFAKITANIEVIDKALIEYEINGVPHLRTIDLFYKKGNVTYTNCKHEKLSNYWLEELIDNGVPWHYDKTPMAVYEARNGAYYFDTKKLNPKKFYLPGDKYSIGKHSGTVIMSIGVDNASYCNPETGNNMWNIALVESDDGYLRTIKAFKSQKTVLSKFKFEEMPSHWARVLVRNNIKWRQEAVKDLLAESQRLANEESMYAKSTMVDTIEDKFSDFLGALGITSIQLGNPKTTDIWLKE